MLVSVSDFNSFLKKILSEKLLSIQEIIIPSMSKLNGDKSKLFFRLLRDEDIIIDPGDFRTVDPAKILFYLPREILLPADYKIKKRLILGLKACDINALAILDKALTGSGFNDPSYKHWRDNSIIISSDCNSFLPNCYCTFLGGRPFPENGFDLNLSKIDDQYMIESGSPKGDDFLDVLRRHTTLFQPSFYAVNKIRKSRLELINKLNNRIQNDLNISAEKYAGKSEETLWTESSEKCIGCGCCTNICPSCYCLILNDESTENEFIKVRSYDSCQLNGYARVAGGGTPRPKILQRFRNRIMCKFNYMPDNFNIPGCTGCGRCMDICSLGNDFMLLGKTVLNNTLSDRTDEFNNIFEIYRRKEDG
ncbi:MAG: 4Fe-4S dicluster domain-containing protein [Bacillota bacterium]